MPNLGDALYDIILKSSDLHPSVFLGEVMGCDPVNQLVFGRNYLVGGGVTLAMSAWGYDSDGSNVHLISQTTVAAGSSPQSVLDQGIDTENLRFFDGDGNYCKMYSYEADGSNLAENNRASNVGFFGGTTPVCDPSRGVVIGMGNTSNWLSYLTYTPAALTWRGRANVVTGAVTHYPVIDIGIRRLFVGNSGAGPIESFDYYYNVAPVLVDSFAAVCASHMGIDETLGFIFFVDGGGDLNILSYNADGTFGANTVVALPYTTSTYRLIVNVTLRIIVLKKGNSPYGFYSMKYDENKNCTLLDNGEFDVAYLNYGQHASDPINSIFFASDFDQSDYTVAAYKYYQEYVRDYSARATPTSGRAPLVVNCKATRTEGYE